jgi:hypothetical protein
MVDSFDAMAGFHATGICRKTCQGMISTKGGIMEIGRASRCAKQHAACGR